MIDTLTTAAWFLLAICILVPVHEYGHFAAMRVFGVKVLRFSVGFGHRLFSWTDSRGTEFAFSAIPLGGYVKPLDEANGEIAAHEREFTLSAKRPWQRIIIFAAGPVANFLLAILFYWFLFLAKGTTEYAPVVGEVEADSIAAKAGLSSGQEIIAIDGQPVRSQKDVAMILLTRLGESGSLRFTVKYPDSSLSYESEAYLESWLRDAEDPDPLRGLGLRFWVPPLGKVIDKVLPGSPAATAGFQSGDELLSADGQPLASWQAWVDYVRARPATPISVEVERAGQTLLLTLVPESITGENGELSGRAGVSVVLPEYPADMLRVRDYSPVGAFSAAINETVEASQFILLSMKKLFFGEISTKNLSGPIGIAKVAASHAEHGFWAFVFFLAHLSVVLAVLNLLPIPVLDGGHIVFALIEWVKGSPVSQGVQAWSLNIGIAMLFGVMIVAFYNDILRL